MRVTEVVHQRTASDSWIDGVYLKPWFCQLAKLLIYPLQIDSIARTRCCK